jgi:hypothetical protein
MTTLPWLADALRAEGCKVVEEGDWKHHYRSGSFSPYGVLWHHTGSTSSASNPFPTKNVLINGRPDLDGPLCQVGIGYDGVCHVISAGRANHAGACNGFGPFSSSQDGNSQLVGFEIDYDGTQAMSAAQKDAATRCSAAVLKRFNRDQGYAANHSETSTTGKWDTGGLSGNQIRALVGDYLENGSDDVPLTDDDIRKIWNAKTTNPVTGGETTMSQLLRWAYGDAHAVWRFPTTSPVDGAETDTLKLLRWSYGEVQPLQAQLADIQSQLDAITEQLGGDDARDK